MTEYLGQPDDMDDDRLLAHIFELRDKVQAEFDSLTPDGDTGPYDARIAELDRATGVARERGIDVPPGK